MPLNESIVEDADLEQFRELGYSIGHGPHFPPGEPVEAWDAFSEVLLGEGLSVATLWLNWAVPSSDLPTLRGMQLPKPLRGKLSLSAANHQIT